MKKIRPERLENAPLQYAPVNEQGVVFLFSKYVKKHRLVIEKIRGAFPDCIAYQKVGGEEKRVRIEFEYKSKNFSTHHHSAKGCDWIVCWEHNWPGIPKHLQVVELRKEFGLGFNVWVQPVSNEYKKQISKVKSSTVWSVPSEATKGDLILFYHNSPDQCFKQVFRLDERVDYVKAGWKKGKDYMGRIRYLTTLPAPIFFQDLKRDRVLRTAGFVRGLMQGRPKVTEYWPYIHEMILRRNPRLKSVLSRFDPENI